MGWQGKVVEYLYQGKLELGVVLEEQKEKLRILGLSKKEKKLPPKKVLHSGNSTLDGTSSKESLLVKLREIQQKREQLQDEIHLEEIWQLLWEEEEGGYTYKDLVDLYCGSQESDDQTGAFLRSLYTDYTYFKRQRDVFLPNSPEVVEKIREKKAREEENERAKALLCQWVNDFWNEKSPPPLDEPLRQKLVSQLKEVVLNKASNKVKNRVATYLKEGSIPQRQGPFGLLVKMGVFEEDENLTLLEYGLSPDFSPEILSASQKVEDQFQKVLALEKERRTCYSNVDIFAIDEDTTLDRDDALSLEMLPDGYRLGVHISDVAQWIEADGLLDDMALGRATSIYMVGQTIDMLPSQLTGSVLSLDEGQERLALSLWITLNKEGTIQKYHVEETCVSITHNYSYPQVEEKISDAESPFLELHKLAEILFQKRMDQGGQNIFFPYLEFNIEDGKISCKKVLSVSKSQFLVSEVMILANHLFGSYLHQYDIPALFRNQPIPEGFSRPEKLDYLGLYGVRRFLKRTSVDPNPSHHFTLGLDEYLQATSPIRRYSDIVNQRQLKALLNSETSLSEKEVSQIIQKSETPLDQARQISRARREYFLLKYIKSLQKNSLPALVLNHFPNHRLLVQIHDSLPDLTAEKPSPHLYECTIPYRGDEKIIPGTWISVYIGGVYPREASIQVSFQATLALDQKI